MAEEALVGPFRAFDHRFAIRAYHPEHARHLDALWAGCRSLEDAATIYTLVADHLLADGEVVVESVRPSVLLRELVRRVNAEATASAIDLVVVHASAAQRDGRGFLFPASTESGKTTLVAGLVRAGWSYLSDEAVGVEPSTLELIPYAKPLSVDPGSWEVLADLRPAAPVGWNDEQWQVAPVHIRADAVSRPVSPTAVVFPSYRMGATTALEPLTRSETVRRLADSCFSLASEPDRSLDVLAAVSGRCAGYALTIGDLDEAVVTLEDLVRSR